MSFENSIGPDFEAFIISTWLVYVYIHSLIQPQTSLANSTNENTHANYRKQTGYKPQTEVALKNATTFINIILQANKYHIPKGKIKHASFCQNTSVMKLRDTTSTKNKYNPKLSEVNSEISSFIQQQKKNIYTNSRTTNKTNIHYINKYKRAMQ